MSKTTYEAKAPVIDDFCDPEPQEEKFPGFPCFLFTSEDLKKARSREELPCRCTRCGKTFSVQKHDIQGKIKRSQSTCFCSRSCQISWKHTGGKAPEERKSYVCENCGKNVPVEEYYGSGRFCSEFCNHSYVGRLIHTKEVCSKVSQSLKTYHKQNAFNTFKSKNKTNSNQIASIEDFVRLTQRYNFSDIAHLLKTSRQKIVKLARLYQISELDIFLSPKAKNAIKACRHALGKPFEDGSITLSDFEKVRQECKRLMFEEEMPSLQVCREYLGIDGLRDGQFIKDVFHVQLPSLQEIGKRWHAKSMIDKTEREKYYIECKFRFPDELLPYTEKSELIGRYPWYNPFHPKENGLTKDHMISKKYGYKHNVDTYLMSHPANCEIMLLSDNASKQDKCSLTVEELIERVEWWNENIIHNIFNDFNK